MPKLVENCHVLLLRVYSDLNIAIVFRRVMFVFYKNNIVELCSCLYLSYHARLKRYSKTLKLKCVITKVYFPFDIGPKRSLDA